jgi:hypothetical protein
LVVLPRREGTGLDWKAQLWRQVKGGLEIKGIESESQEDDRDGRLSEETMRRKSMGKIKKRKEGKEGKESREELWR